MVGTDNQYGEVIKARQRMLKEQRFFEALAGVLDCAIKSKEEVDLIRRIKSKDNLNNEEDIFSSPALSSARQSMDTMESARIKLSIAVIEKCYKIITTSCQKNSENQIYAFQFFKVFIKHVGLNLGEIKCMLAILKDNEKLLLEVHDPSAISNSENIIMYFAVLLKRFYKDKRPEILDFLKTICVYKGDGVSVNQEKVYEYIFTNPKIYRKALIPVSSYEGSLFLSLGEERSQVVSVNSCFQDERIIAHTSEILYFTKLLELFANMCLGRNFICTESLRDHFTANVLQNMI